MKLATLRNGTSTVAVRVDSDSAVEIDGFSNVGELLATEGWKSVAEQASGTAHPLKDIAPTRWDAVVPRPGKIVCVGLNYKNHILEMGRELPEFPTLFAKFPEALVGPFDDVELASVSNQVDWEGELAIIIGSPARKVSGEAATAAIAGYAVLNDVTMRDYQYRTPQWLQGKTFENTTPFGPYLVTADELGDDAVLRTKVNGETVQEVAIADLVFDPTTLVSYISDILTLNPGDVIASGTPGGVGHARKPARYLAEGDILETSIDGLGAQSNRAVRVD
ncbi:fumarylacetoacetate hydrolase family protein [Salinibacterium sp. ZJ450]|uniref:fumarylacetoacetate hydrolase family protein n=1 Tax=Salinibacterium sp. ZJ450 TaxID=2708338 RepID=UPI0014238142|nr:fumarylacetoacetate hydrolase family protein [Salinibacterium sp. ZJ450]